MVAAGAPLGTGSASKLGSKNHQGCIEQVTTFQTSEMRYATTYDIAGEAPDSLAYAVQETELSCDFPMAAMVPVLGQEEPALSPACESFLRR